jgi:hypothetical protein
LREEIGRDETSIDARVQSCPPVELHGGLWNETPRVIQVQMNLALPSRLALSNRATLVGRGWTKESTLELPQDSWLLETYLLCFVGLQSAWANESLEVVESKGYSFSIIRELGGNSPLRTIWLPN